MWPSSAGVWGGQPPSEDKHRGPQFHGPLPGCLGRGFPRGLPTPISKHSSTHRPGQGSPQNRRARGGQRPEEPRGTQQSAPRGQSGHRAREGAGAGPGTPTPPPAWDSTRRGLGSRTPARPGAEGGGAWPRGKGRPGRLHQPVSMSGRVGDLSPKQQEALTKVSRRRWARAGRTCYALSCRSWGSGQATREPRCWAAERLRGHKGDIDPGGWRGGPSPPFQECFLLCRAVGGTDCPLYLPAHPAGLSGVGSWRCQGRLQGDPQRDCNRGAARDSRWLQARCLGAAARASRCWERVAS